MSATGSECWVCTASRVERPVDVSDLPPDLSSAELAARISLRRVRTARYLVEVARRSWAGDLRDMIGYAVEQGMTYDAIATEAGVGRSYVARVAGELKAAGR